LDDEHLGYPFYEKEKGICFAVEDGLRYVCGQGLYPALEEQRFRPHGLRHRFD